MKLYKLNQSIIDCLDGEAKEKYGQPEPLNFWKVSPFPMDALGECKKENHILLVGSYVAFEQMKTKVKTVLVKGEGFTEGERQDIEDFLNKFGSIENLNNLSIEWCEHNINTGEKLTIFQWLKKVYKK